MGFFKEQRMEAEEVSLKDLRNFGLVFSGILMSIILWSIFRHSGYLWKYFVLGAGVAIFIQALWGPHTLRTLYFCAICLGRFMGTIQSTILLFVVFWGLMVPLGWLLRVCGNLPDLGFDPKLDTYRRRHLVKKLKAKREKSF